MIEVANSEIARQTARRRTSNGWFTSFIGANRHTLGPTERIPGPGVLHPMAFLVEKEAGAVVKPHFHQADQFQVVMSGGCRLGLHDVAGIAVHYTDAYSAYGPIVAAAEGVAWFTLRNAWDLGARYMPRARAELRAARARHQHRELTAPPLPATDAVGLALLEQEIRVPVLEPEADGLAGWRYQLPSGAALRGPDPSSGGGQFWLVLAGDLQAAEPEVLPPRSCLFVAPDADALSATAGAGGVEMLCVQFPARMIH